MSDRSAAITKLLSMLKLSEGWCGRGAVPPSPQAITWSMSIIKQLPEGIPAPDITPTPNGALSLEWDRNGNYMEIVVGDAAYSAHWVIGKRTRASAGLLGEKIPPALVDGLESLYGIDMRGDAC